MLQVCICELLAALQVSGDDSDEYKRGLRAQLKALIEREKDPLGPTEWVVCYIKPATADALSKGPRKVMLITVLQIANDIAKPSAMHLQLILVSYCPSPYHWYKHIESFSVYLISSVQCIKALNQQLQVAVAQLNGASLLPESKHGQQICLQDRLASVELHFVLSMVLLNCFAGTPFAPPLIVLYLPAASPSIFCPPRVGPGSSSCFPLPPSSLRGG